jgi:uncharacterized spore protein YtfJ
MSNNVVEVLKGVVGELREIANSQTIIGDAITVGDKTVIPVIKVSVGFGAGGGQGEAGDKGQGFGGGGGGGAKIEPAAFIIMDDKGIKLLSAGKGKWDQIFEAIPGIAGKIGDFAKKLKTEKGEGDAEADDDESIIDDLPGEGEDK